MTATVNTLKLIAEQLNVLCQKRATGELVIGNSQTKGRIYLLSGRLLYAKAGIHETRRWNRITKRLVPDWIPNPKELHDAHMWEYQLLYQGINHKQITVVQAKAIIRAIAQEVFFDLGCYGNATIEWQENSKQATEIALSLSLSYLEVDPDISKVVALQRQWQSAGLGNLSPTLAPVLRTGVNPSALGVFGRYLNGQSTLWDISVQLGKSVTNVTKALIPLLKKRIVQLKKITDLPHPLAGMDKAASSSARQSRGSQEPSREGLIACIDDSPVILQTLKKILEGAGYKTLAINEPMRGVAKLIENQPDIIILDLVMPNASGYSVCKFLRQTSVFEKTPIIVLTSRDTLIDRNRAKLVGASDFLGKPPDAEKTLALVEKYLEEIAEKKQTTDQIPVDVGVANSALSRNL
ncbi:response regulator receiver protein [[Leptolyngbya] sp. PCC 7376]|uniref:response regulator n=1 Tax=[Leptolyngbya] sp. PCC 7376 TaxID=111781 RepID=UPI00029EFD11|nr:response regulator [[Leptolyngbya] sp. PCC 7376]AFY38021.1 response regulator receiver protein [[Leptolyngbya] sp. PCC 7376]